MDVTETVIETTSNYLIDCGNDIPLTIIVNNNEGCGVDDDEDEGDDGDDEDEVYTDKSKNSDDTLATNYHNTKSLTLDTKLLSDETPLNTIKQLNNFENKCDVLPSILKRTSTKTINTTTAVCNTNNSENNNYYNTNTNNNNYNNNNNNNNYYYNNDNNNIGCKQPSPDVIRRVSFPMEQSELVNYYEPENNSSWLINKYLPSELILQIYQTSCKNNQTIELDIIKQLILEIKNNTNHSAILNLSTINITNEVNETIEDLLKISNFHKLLLYDSKFTTETISEFLNMIEYYESVREIELSTKFNDSDAWKCFCNACSNIMVLETISFKNMSIDDNYMQMLLNSVKNNPTITTLKFDGCTLSTLPSFYLIENLITNRTICELYLPSTGLYTKEADCLGHFLQKNFYLKVLDISNNFIGDRGLEALAKGLINQNTLGIGLSVLVIFNNQITEKSGPIINNIITECKNLHTLNIGFNNLTDQVLNDIKNSLEETNSLEGLGLQSTLLTCKGIQYLCEAIENNHSLQKINLKGNKAIEMDGLERLCQALTNSKIARIEVDEINRSCHDPQAYIQLVKKINAICTVNKSFKDSENCDILNISQLISRKVSLSCEPRFLIPEKVKLNDAIETTTKGGTKTITKSRFKITNVQDPQPIRSRFQVTRVIPTTTTTTTSTLIATATATTTTTSSSSNLNNDNDFLSSSTTNSKFSTLRSSVSSSESAESILNNEN